MIRKLKKKAFTLVELLVVIAILAVLATVAIVGYGAFTKKAKESNDIYLVKQMNIVLEASEVLDGKNKTMTDALDDVFDKGYDLTKLTPTSEKYNIVWDGVNDRMVLLNEQREIVFPKEKMSANKDLYVIVSTKDEIENTYKDYSFYLRDNFNNNQEISLSISNGIDVGNNENITSISYANGTKHTVAIRTNGGSLTINASQDTVNHFGWVKELDVQSVATSDCYHEYGFVGELKTFASGKFVAYDGCEFHQTKEAVESVIRSNGKNLTKAKFGQHYYDKDGICVVETCTGTDGHRATNETHNHQYENGVCKCGYAEDKCAQGHKFTYENKNDGKYHLAKCQNCNHEEVQEHTFDYDNLCSKCNAKKPCEHKNAMYTDNNDGLTHNMKCSKYDCDYGPSSNGKDEPHIIEDGKCTKCSYSIKTFELNTLKLSIVEVEEDGKIIYKLKVSDENGLLDTENYTYVLEETFDVDLVCTQTWHSGYAAYDPMETLSMKFEQPLQADGIFNYYKKTINMKNNGVETIERIYLKHDDENNIANAEVLLSTDPFGKGTYHLHMSGESHLSGLHHSDYCTTDDAKGVPDDAEGLQLSFSNNNEVFHTLIVKDKTGKIVKTIKYVSDKNQEIKIYNENN